VHFGGTQHRWNIAEIYAATFPNKDSILICLDDAAAI
jgi:hypothetical protein